MNYMVDEVVVEFIDFDSVSDSYSPLLLMVELFLILFAFLSLTLPSTG